MLGRECGRGSHCINKYNFMAVFAVEGREYEIIIASDISSRDGIGAELWDRSSNEMIIEAFRDDTLKKLTFFVAKQIDIPLDLLDKLLQAFDEIPGRIFIDYDSPEWQNLT